MKRATKLFLSSMLLIPLAAPLSALVAQQPTPPPDQSQNEPGGPPPGDDNMEHPGGPQGGRGGGMRRQPGPDRGPDRGPDMRGDQRGGPHQGPGDMNGFDRMRGYLDLVDRFSRLARDPAASGVAAVIAAGDILRPRGADATIDFYNKAMANTKNDTVKRAIRLQLVDLYRQSGQNEKALEQLNQLIADAPAGDVQTAPVTPPR